MVMELLTLTIELLSGLTSLILFMALTPILATGVLISPLISVGCWGIKFTMEKMRCGLICTILNHRWLIIGTVTERATQSRVLRLAELIMSHQLILFRVEHSSGFAA